MLFRSNQIYYYNSKGNFVGVKPGEGLKGYEVKPYKDDGTPMNSAELTAAIMTKGELERLKEIYKARHNISLVDRYKIVNGVKTLYWTVNGKDIYPYKETGGSVDVITVSDFNETIRLSKGLFDLKASTPETAKAQEKTLNGVLYWDVKINGKTYKICPVKEITKNDGAVERRLLTKQC